MSDNGKCNQIVLTYLRQTVYMLTKYRQVTNVGVLFSCHVSCISYMSTRISSLWIFRNQLLEHQTKAFAKLCTITTVIIIVVAIIIIYTLCC